MKYRIGLPFWKTLARCGLSLTFRVNISKDQDRNCYYVSSSDLGGLTTEAKTLEELGKILGFSKERIRQIECIALKKLRFNTKVQQMKDYIS